MAALCPETSMPFCTFISKYQTNKIWEVLEQFKRQDTKGGIKMLVQADAPGICLSYTMF